jgi:hypothetical protein
LWDDPFENLLISCGITYRNEPGRPQDFFDRLRKPLFAQCWSFAAESDALWRIYSTVDKDPGTQLNRVPDLEGMKLRTTPRKLLAALSAGVTTEPENTCFLGAVRYLPQEDLVQLVADEVSRDLIDAFAGARGHAESLLFKRAPFEHEREVRLMYVDWDAKNGSLETLSTAVRPSELIDEVILDPRLSADDVRLRHDQLRALGFSGGISKSPLYQRSLFEIVVG